MSSTPSVITVNRGTGVDMCCTHRSEQTELLAKPLRPGEMIRGQLGAALVEPEFFAGDLEAAADNPGHRAGPLHPGAPLRIVVLAAPHLADQGEDVAIAVRIIGQQPFAEQ